MNQTTDLSTHADPAKEKLEKLCRELAAGRAACAQKPTVGQRFSMPRDGLEPVDVLLYRPAADSKAPLPVLFNLHGGGWIGGDATLMESFCQLMADRLRALVVNVNYKKADVHPLPYPQEELRDAVLYFAAHAAEYGIDPARMVIGGHSAGAHISTGAAMLLKQAGFALAGQMLVYPVTDMTPGVNADDSSAEQFRTLIFPQGGETTCWGSPLRATEAQLRGLAPTVAIICGKDDLREQGLAYLHRLKENGVPVQYREYAAAQHGFLEVNRPDYPADDRQTPEQAALARDAEDWLAGQLQRLFAAADA